MKKIKKILIFVLCAFAVLFTVGFSNVNAATTGEKVASVSALTDGKYVIVANNGGYYYLKNSQSSGKPKAVSITISNGVIASVPQDAIWDFKKNTNGTWDISTTTNKLVTTGDSTGSIAVKGLNDLGSSVTEWTLTDSGKYVSFKTSSSTSREIALYKTQDFRYYGSSNGEHTIEIYKCIEDTNNFSVEFNTNGGSSVPSQNVALNGKVNRPTNPTKTNYDFVNWYTTKELTPGTEYNFETAVTANITLYAKWKAASYINFVKEKTKSSLNIAYAPTSIEINGQQYNKVSATKEDWTGTYFIVYEDKGKAYIFNGLDQENGYKLSDIIENSVLVDSTYDNCKVEIAKMEGGYSLKTNSGYIYGTSGSNGLEYNDKTPKLNTLTYKTDGHVEIKSDNTYFSFNAASNQMRFRYYKNTGQNAVYLYEMGEQVTKTVESYEVSNISLRFGLMFDAVDYDAMVAEGAKFGLSLTKDKGTEQFIECTPVRVNEKGVEDAQGKFYQFAVVLTNIPSTDYEVSVNAKCYVEINGVKHMTSSKNSSVKQTANDYISAADTSAYTEHLGVLGFLAK